MKLYCVVDGDEFVTYGIVRRTVWRKGPWDNEPEDRIYWIDPKTRLDCLAMRNEFGEWCGYVGVPRANKFYGENKNGTLLMGTYAPGEITYADSSSEDDIRIRSFLKGRPEIVWWIGFDTGGLNNDCPARDPISERRMGVNWKPVYKDLNFVRKNITKLAEELAED